MAEVWLAWDEQLQIDVALKLLVPQVILDEEGMTRFRARFRREADAIRRLDSPHIVRLIDFGESGGSPYMALSYINGKPLSTVLREEGAQPANRVREIARQMADGLEVAHANGVLHRDLKPANVMLTRTAQGRDHVVLVDFGIAHVLRSATGETLTRITSEGSMIGTPRYLPPEYIRGDHFDERSDLFALGLILYEMLEGEAAVGGQDTVQIIARHLDKAPFHMRQDIAAQDPALASVVHSLLEKNPNGRLQSARALRQVLFDGTVVAPREPTHTVEQQAKSGEDRADIATVALAVFILFVAVAGGFVLFGGSDTSEADAIEAEQVGVVIGENEAEEVAEEVRDEVRTAAVGDAVDQASLKLQFAMIDAKGSARPGAQDSESEPQVAEADDKPPGLRVKLPENETMNKIREVIPSLTLE